MVDEIIVSGFGHDDPMLKGTALACSEAKVMWEPVSSLTARGWPCEDGFRVLGVLSVFMCVSPQKAHARKKLKLPELPSDRS